MKKRNKIIVALLSLLLVSMLVITGVTVLKRHQMATAVTADVSWYDESGKEFSITTAEQLYGLAQLSESHDFKGQTIKLDADIVVNEGNAEDWVKTVPEKLWIPITGFAGKFDGQGHTISGIYGDSIITSLGLFTNTQKTCVIKNLKLVNSCFKNNNEKGTGSIIGVGGGKLENIYSDAVIVSAGKYVGGLIGRVVEKGENQITNCWFDGTITMKGANASEVGGLVGAFTVEDALNAIQHCLSTADIECMGKQVGGIVGNLGSNSFLNLIDTMYTGTLKYDTNYYDKVGSAIGVITGGSSAIIKDTYTVDEIANRTIGTNGGYQEGSAIAIGKEELIGVGGYQWTTLDFDNYWAVQTDDMPILSYFAEKSESVEGLERLVDISWYTPTGMTFEIKNAKEFYGFAYLSRSYDFSGQTIKLGADITINEGNAQDWQEEAPKNKWTPIAWHGTSLSKRFKGNFDGQGHTISGIYVKGDEDDGYIGLFGEIYNGSVVKNFKIVNSYFEGTMESSARGTVGSVCGRLRGTIDSVYSDAIIVNSAKMTGGIAGMINGTGQNTISNCWFDGKITGVSRTGGILGGVYGNKANIEATIEHCLNTGDIAVQIGKGDVGGMCGIAETWCTLYINDCLNTGTFTTVGEGKKANTHIGTIFGSVTQTSDVGSKVIITNSFGTKEFYSKLVGWKFGDEGVEQSSVAFVSAEEVKGYGGYQWTTLDFKDSWAVRTDDVPVPVVFATSRPSVSGVARMVDYSWYDANSDVMTIKTYQQLYAMARLWDVTNLFKDKTIKLGADIVVNEGNAADWAEKAPALVWEPMKFNGTFDGQGHTISGIYVKGGEEDNYVGLFHRVYQNGVVKNLKLVNSYIEGTMASNVRGAVGSIAGRNNGIIDAVYSNAIVVNSARMTGGLVGMITGEGQNTIENSWFDGKVTGVSRTGGILGGVYGNKEDIEANIAHCLNTGAIAVEIGYGDVGGICGMVETGGTLNLADSLNAGTFATVGEGKEPNTHIGTIVGSITKTDDVSSKVVMKDVYGVQEFSSKLVGWTFGNEGVSQTTVHLTEMEKVKGFGGYQWTTLDFDKYWAARTEDVPVPSAFAETKQSLTEVTKMADYSWYDPDSDVYVIKTFQQLYGFAVLCNADSSYFADKTVKLGADITINEGNAADWAEKAPAYEWIPVKFKGTFDGQGHTISGIYVKGGEEDNYIGFFHRVYTGATVKNFKLVNSYIEGTMASNVRGAVGSIAGRNNGTIDSVYSDAIVVNSARMTGGLVGMITGSGENKITNSWFDGQITGITRTGGILGGVYGNKENIEANIEHCLNTGDITVPVNYEDVGGLCGMVETWATLNLTDSLNAGTFTHVGEGEAKTHIGTIVGSVTETEDVGSRVVMNHVYGVKEFNSKLVGWSWDKTSKGVSKSSVNMVSKGDITGYKGYQWTTLDFDNSWAVRKGDAPVPVVFAESVPSLAGHTRMVDYSWYDEDKDEYTISTLQQLYGFNLLCDADHDYFKDKTVYLGADIALNDVDEDFDANTWATTAPANVWAPTNFKGTLDGQGYTLSGIYVKSDETYTGFFKTLESGAVVKNLNLENSYIEGTKTNGRCGTGSIAGRNRGIIDTVYSNAVVKNGALMTGGIAGMTDTTSETENKIVNCWFDGQIYANGSTGGILGGAYKASANIESCLNTGVMNINDGSYSVGGLCGNVQDASSVTINDSLNAGTLVKKDGATIKQLGSIVGALGNKGTLTIGNVYGISDFSANKLGYHDKGTLDQVENTVSAVRKLDDIKGYGAYQWTLLDFEDKDADEIYWVLRDGKVPALAVFDKTDLNLEEAKKLSSYTWYDAELDSYIIYTPKELIGFSELSAQTTINGFKDKTIKLGADITLNDGNAEAWEEEPPTIVWEPQDFNGTFDGQKHTISGVYVKTSNGVVYTGFFKAVKSGATVKNLNIVNSYIEGTNTTNTRAGVGSVAGRLYGTIDSVKSEAILKNGKQMTGGIAGMTTGTEALITNCWFDGQIRAVGSSGGILGGTYTSSATIEHCLNTGTLNITSGEAIGGLIGRAQSSSSSGSTVIIRDSLNAGTYVKVGDGTVSKIGTIAGRIDSTSTLKLNDVYGVEEFSSNLVGDGVITDTQIDTSEIISTFTLRPLNDIKGYGAYQWTSLEFVNIDENGNNKAHWVLKDKATPVLAVFDESDLDLETAQTYDRYAWYADVDGKTTFTISSAQQMYEFYTYCFNDDDKFFIDRTIKLGADITMNNGNAEGWDTTTTAPDNKWTPLTFAGCFDGQGHTISGMYVRAGNKFAGIFQNIRSGAVVKDFRIVNSYLESTSSQNNGSLGSVAGRNYGTIDSVYSEAILKNEKNRNNMTGGIVGMNTDTGEQLIKNCWFAGKIYATNYVGGIQGGTYNSNATIEHCLNTGELNVKSEKAIGGLFGYVWGNSNVILRDCLNAGTYVKAGTDTDGKIGSIVGKVDTTGNLQISDVYGVEEFSTHMVGEGIITDNEIDSTPEEITTTFALVELNDLKGTGGYQWTTLDFEDTDGSGEDKAYWVLRAGKVPAPAVFGEAALDLSQVENLAQYNWYANDAGKTTYTISSAQQLYEFNSLCDDDTNNFSGKNINLGADITMNSGDAEDWATSAPDNQWTPIILKGTYNGQGHTISGVYAKKEATDATDTEIYTGLFDTICSGAKVTNVKLVNSYFEGKGSLNRSAVGSITGLLQGEIDTVYSSAIVKNSKQMTGGIAGIVTASNTAQITNCWFDGQIYVSNNACGGILGGTYGVDESNKEDNKATIKHCLNTGILNIEANNKTVKQIGGIFGYVQNCSSLFLEDSLNAGKCNKTISGKNGKIQQVGTTIGSGHAKGSVNVSNVYGVVEDFSGNLIGWTGSPNVTAIEHHSFPTVADCYGLGNIDGDGTQLKLTFYAEGQSSEDDGDEKLCWWRARTNNIPMLESFEDLANTLGK